MTDRRGRDDAPPRSRSNVKLALFIALLLVPPLLLVVGPFHDRFFPRDVARLRELARVPTLRLDLESLRALVGAKTLDEATLAELKHDLDEQRWEAVVARLGARPRDAVTPGLMYLHGAAALLERRPAVAVAGLEAASRAGDPALAHEATFALAQAMLMLDRGDAARPLLRELAAGSGPHAPEAAAQLAELDRPR